MRRNRDHVDLHFHHCVSPLCSQATISSIFDTASRALDATYFDQLETGADRANQMFGSVDGIVNCVGSVLLKPAHLRTPTEWHNAVATNLTSAFATVRAGFKAMRKPGAAGPPTRDALPLDVCWPAALGR